MCGWYGLQCATFLLQLGKVYWFHFLHLFCGKHSIPFCALIPSVQGNGQGLLLPGHLDIVNYGIVQSGLKQWICFVIDSTGVCKYAWTLAATLYLLCIRLQVINKRTVFLSRKSRECSETPRGHGWRRERQTTARSAGLMYITINRRGGARRAKWESKTNTVRGKETLIFLIHQPGSLWDAWEKLIAAVGWMITIALFVSGCVKQMKC